MAATRSQSTQNDDVLHSHPNPTHSGTLDLPNSPQSPSPVQQDDSVLILDGDDHQSGNVPEPIDVKIRTNKRKKAGARKTYKRKRPMKKVQNLTGIFNPIPFVPKKTLDFVKYEDVLKRLGLYEFSKIEFDRSLRTDLIVELIVNYDAKRRCSYVDDLRINVNRADLARALKLPPAKQDRGGNSVEEVDLDSEVFSDEMLVFIEDFVLNWFFLWDGSGVMPAEVVNWTRCIKDGHPEKLDPASLIWYKVEKELTQGDKLVECYYASHLQQLIKSQKPLFFKEEGGAKENVIADEEKDDNEEKDDKEEEEKNENESKGEKEEEEEKNENESKDEKEEKDENELKDEKEEKDENELKDEKEEKDEIESKDGKEVKDENELKDEKEEKDENELKDEKEEEENVSVIQEQNIELNLGTDVEEMAHEEAVKDDEMIVEAEEGKKEMEEQVDFKNVLGDHDHFLQRCQSGSLNKFEEVKVQEVEDEQVEHVEDEDEQDEQVEHVEDEDEQDEHVEHVEDEDEEEEEGGEMLDEGFDMEANVDSFNRDELTDNFLRGVETSHDPYNSHGMSSMDLFGARDGSFMSHGGPSFYNNGGKRVMEPEEDIHHLDQNSKRLKTDETWDPKQNDMGYCFDQIQQWMQKAKMVHESKERSYENLQYNQQIAMNQLQERQQIMEMIIKSKDEELEKKHAEVFRLERELYLMGDLLSGYRKALNDTRFKFTEYRKRFALKEEPLYKDAGPGGLVLSTREIEKQRLKQEEDMMKFQNLAKNIEEEYVYQLEMQNSRLSPMLDKLDFIVNEVQRLKEIATQPKEARDEPSAELEPSVEPEETQKLVDEEECLVEPEKNQNSVDEVESCVQPEKNQKPMDVDECSVEPENNQKSVDEDEPSVEPEKNQKSLDEADASMEGIPPEAVESEEKRGGEEED